ncbi:MAG: choice-of-anchor Q domain-containing protein [Leptolyngbyaceae cyanobacterium]
MAVFYVQANAPNTNNGNSWGTATSLQTALANANAGDEIWLAQGTYSPGNNPTDTFTVNQAVQLYGGFDGTEATRNQRDWQANQTIIDGNGDNNTVVTAQSTANEALIDGVIIQGGDAVDDGGGVYNQGGGKLRLQNTIIRDNQAADDGGGIRNNGELVIVNSSVISNTSIGTTSTSGGGGLLNASGASVTIISSTFSGNTARNGGGVRNDGTLDLTNSTLSGNIASESGGGLSNTVNVVAPGIVLGRATATIANSTITNNEAQNVSEQPIDTGGGVANFGVVTVTNSIIAANVDNDDIVNINFFIGAGSTTTAGNNLIGNGDNTPGLTNGSNGDQVGSAVTPFDPQLDTLQANGGFTQTHAPLVGSPVIDAGTTGTVPADAFDLDRDGNTAEVISVDQRGIPFARVGGTAVDIGAVEGVVVPAGITFSPITGLLTTELGGSDTFTAVLTSQPNAAVTLNFTSDDVSEGTIIPSITFSTADWYQPQTVTVTGVDDTTDDDDVDYIINTSISSTDIRYSTIAPAAVTVTNQDNDEPEREPTDPTTPPVPAALSFQGERLIVDGPGDMSIEFSISQNVSEQVREIIVFATDSAGAVSGLVSGDTGYLDAVLSTAQVVFSTLESGDIAEFKPQRTLMVTAGSSLQFAVIDSGSLDSMRRGAGGVLSLSGANAPAAKLQTLNDGTVQVGLFGDLVVNAAIGVAVPVGASLQGLSVDSELIDLRDQTGPLSITVDIYREAKLDSVVGLFVVENEQGQVRDPLGVLLNPGDTGYAQAALAQRLDLEMMGENDRTVRYTGEVSGAQLLSTFLVVDGLVADLLDTDLANDPAIYFTHGAGNSDGVDHVRLLGDNVFGFEDIAGGGDMDFDDVVMQATFA